MSRIKRNTLVSGGVRGTLPWMAPELLNGSSSKVSEKVIVLRFFIIMYLFERSFFANLLSSRTVLPNWQEEPSFKNKC